MALSLYKRTVKGSELSWIEVDENWSRIEDAVGGKVDSTEKGANNGVGSLDSSGKQPLDQLSPYVMLLDENTYQDVPVKIVMPDSGDIDNLFKASPQEGYFGFVNADNSVGKIGSFDVSGIGNRNTPGAYLWDFDNDVMSILICGDIDTIDPIHRNEFKLRDLVAEEDFGLLVNNTELFVGRNNYANSERLSGIEHSRENGWLLFDFESENTVFGVLKSPTEPMFMVSADGTIAMLTPEYLANDPSVFVGFVPNIGTPWSDTWSFVSFTNDTAAFSTKQSITQLSTFLTGGGLSGFNSFIEDVDADVVSQSSHWDFDNDGNHSFNWSVSTSSNDTRARFDSDGHTFSFSNGEARFMVSDDTETEIFFNITGDGDLSIAAAGDKLGFFGKTPVLQQEVSGSATVEDLIDALDLIGLIKKV